MTQANEPPKVSKFLTISKVIASITYGFIVVGIAFLSMSFILLLLAASPESGFVEFVYKTAEVFMAPFRGIFPVRQFNGDHYFDAAALFAIVMYLIFGMLVSALSKYLERKITQEQAELLKWQRKVEEEKRLEMMSGYLNRDDTNVNIVMDTKSGNTQVNLSKPKSSVKKVGGR